MPPRHAPIHMIQKPDVTPEAESVNLRVALNIYIHCWYVLSVVRYQMLLLFSGRNQLNQYQMNIN